MFISELFLNDLTVAEGFSSPPPLKDMIAVSGEGEEIAVGDKIRTKKTQVIGKVEKIKSDKFNENDDVIFFRVEDGRLMKTSRRNCVKINPEIEEAKNKKNKDDIHWKPVDTIRNPLGTPYSPKNKYVTDPNYNSRLERQTKTDELTRSYPD